MQLKDPFDLFANKILFARHDFFPVYLGEFQIKYTDLSTRYEAKCVVPLS
jgi:hypothetical protein